MLARRKEEAESRRDAFSNRLPEHRKDFARWVVKQHEEQASNPQGSDADGRGPTAAMALQV
jgi:hypothetical protein